MFDEEDILSLPYPPSPPSHAYHAILLPSINTPWWDLCPWGSSFILVLETSSPGWFRGKSKKSISSLTLSIDTITLSWCYKMVVFTQVKRKGEPLWNIKLTAFLSLPIKQGYLNQYTFSVHVLLGGKRRWLHHKHWRPLPQGLCACARACERS